MARSGKSKLLGCLLASLAAGGLIIWITTQSRPQPQPSFLFIGYTNSRGQMEALFRLDHPPPRLLSDGLDSLRYHSLTGWARPSAPSISWRYFGWDGTGSLAAVSVETTNVPARIVMSMWVRRDGIGGVYDRVLDAWEKLRGKTGLRRGFPTYVSNGTVVATSAQ